MYSRDDVPNILFVLCNTLNIKIFQEWLTNINLLPGLAENLIQKNSDSICPLQLILRKMQLTDQIVHYINRNTIDDVLNDYFKNIILIEDDNVFYKYFVHIMNIKKINVPKEIGMRVFRYMDKFIREPQHKEPSLIRPSYRD